MSITFYYDTSSFARLTVITPFKIKHVFTILTMRYNDMKVKKRFTISTKKEKVHLFDTSVHYYLINDDLVPFDVTIKNSILTILEEG